MPRGRRRVQQRRPQVEIADREGSPNSSSSDLIPETQDLQDTQTHPSSEEEGVEEEKDSGIEERYPRLPLERGQ